MALRPDPNSLIKDSRQRGTNEIISQAGARLVSNPLSLIQDSSDRVTNALIAQSMETTQGIAQATQLADSPNALPQMIMASMQPEAEIAKATNGKSSYVQSAAVRQLTMPSVATGNRDSLGRIKPMTKKKEAEVPEQTLQAHDKIAQHTKQVAHNDANAHDNATGHIKFVAGNTVSLDSVHRTSFSSDGSVVIQAPHQETHATGVFNNYVHKTEWGHLSTAAIDSQVVKSTTSAKYTVTDLTVASEIQGLVGKSGYRDTSDFIHDTTTHHKSDSTIYDNRASQSASIRSLGSINYQAAESYLLSIGAPTPSGPTPGFFNPGGLTNTVKGVLGQVGFGGLGSIAPNKGYVKTVDNKGQESIYSMSRDIFSMKTKEVTSKTKTEVIGKEHHTISRGLVTNLSKGISLEGISGGVLKLSNKKFSVIMKGLLGDVASPIVDQIMGCMEFPELPELPEVDIPKALGVDLTQILDLKCGNQGQGLESMGHTPSEPTGPDKTLGGNIASGHRGGFPSGQPPEITARNTFPSKSVPGGAIPPVIQGASQGQPSSGSKGSGSQSSTGSSSGGGDSSSTGGAAQSNTSTSTQTTTNAGTPSSRMSSVVSPVFNTPIGIYLDRYMGDTLPAGTEATSSTSTNTTGPSEGSPKTLRGPQPPQQDPITQALMGAVSNAPPDAIKAVQEVMNNYALGQVTKQEAQQQVIQGGFPVDVFNSLVDSDAMFNIAPMVQMIGGLDVGKVANPTNTPNHYQAGLTGLISGLLNDQIPQVMSASGGDGVFEAITQLAKQVGIDATPLAQLIGPGGEVNERQLVESVLGKLNLPSGVEVKTTKGIDGEYQLELNANGLLEEHLGKLTEMVGGMGPLKKVYGILDQLGIGEGLQGQVSKLLDQVMSCATNWLNLKAIIGLPEIDLGNLQSLFPKSIAGVPVGDAQDLMKSIGVNNPMELASMLGDITKMDLSNLPDMALKLLKGWGLCKGGGGKGPNPMGHM